MKTLQKLVVTSVLLLSQTALFADQEPTRFLLKIKAKKGSAVDSFYTYYSHGDSGDNTEFNYDYISLKVDTSEAFIQRVDSQKSLFYDNNYLKSNFFYDYGRTRPYYIRKSSDITFKVEKFNLLPFKFGKREIVDFSKYDSVKVDSILEAGFPNNFRMLDSTTYNTLTTQKVISSFTVFLEEGGDDYLCLDVVSLDKKWSDDFFLTQLYGFQLHSNFKSQYNSNQLMDTWEKSVEYSQYYENKLKRKLPQIMGSNRQGEEFFFKKRLPKTIQEAIQEKKIIVFPSYVW